MHQIIKQIEQRWRRRMIEISLSWKLWSLKQQVELLEWRLRLKGLMPSTTFTLEPKMVRQGGHHAVRTLSRIHG